MTCFLALAAFFKHHQRFVGPRVQGGHIGYAAAGLHLLVAMAYDPGTVRRQGSCCLSIRFRNDSRGCLDVVLCAGYLPMRKLMVSPEVQLGKNVSAAPLSVMCDTASDLSLMSLARGCF